MEHQNILNQAYAKLSHCVDHGVGCWLSADMVKALYFSEVGEKFILPLRSPSLSHDMQHI